MLNCLWGTVFSNSMGEMKYRWIRYSILWASQACTVCARLLSHVRLFVTPWTAVHQAPLYMKFSRQEYWSGLPLPTPLSRWLSAKEFACQCRRCKFDPWVGKIPWRRKWQPTSVFLPGKSHEQRSLAGYSPWGHKESDMTDWSHTQSEAWDVEVIAVLMWMGKPLRCLSFMSLAHHRQTVTQTKGINQMDARYFW